MNPQEPNLASTLDRLSDDDLERRIGALLDGRLDPVSAAEFGRALESSPRARRIRDDLVAIGRSIVAIPVPAPSRELLGRTLERVAAARVAREREVLVLPWIRGIAVAAALVIGANATLFGTAAADSNTESVPTIEDRLAPAPQQSKSDSLSEYLAWYFLGRGR